MAALYHPAKTPLPTEETIEETTEQRVESAMRDPLPWEGVPDSFVPSLVLRYLARTTDVAVGPVATKALELLASGSREDAVQILAALDRAIEREGNRRAKSSALTYAREILALPEMVPLQIVRVFADCAARGQFEPAKRAIRQYRWRHPVNGPALAATLRRWAPRLARKAMPIRPVRHGRIVLAVMAAAPALWLAVKVIKSTAHVGHAVLPSDEQPMPAWTTPAEGEPLEQMHAAAAYLETRAEYFNEKEMLSAVQDLSKTLRKQPLDCEHAARDVDRVHRSMARIKLDVLQSMIGPKLFLLQTLPRVCPAPSHQPTSNQAKGI